MRAAALLAIAACTAGEAAPPAPPACTPRTYRVDRVLLPVAPGAQDALGLDLDGNGSIDNGLSEGLTAAVVLNPDLGDVSALASARLAHGDATWLVSVEECDDRVPRVEVGGRAPPFEVTARPGQLVGRGGEADVPLTVLVDPLGTYEPVTWLHVIGAAVYLFDTRDELYGVIGFAMPMPASQDAVLAPFAAYLTGELRAGTSEYARACDENHDGTCSVDELLTACFPDLFGCGNSARWIVEPDVDLDGTRALSFGVGVHAVPVVP